MARYTRAQRTADAYEILRALVEHVDDDSPLTLLNHISAGVDPEDLLERFHDEHPCSVDRRIAGRVRLERGSGEWVADPGSSLGRPRRFTRRDRAVAWLLSVGPYCTGQDPELGCTHPAAGPHLVVVRFPGRTR